PEELGDALPYVAFADGQKAIRISAGTAFTCALLDSGAVSCWGRNLLGNLGLGDTTARSGRPADGPLPTVDLGRGPTALDPAVGYNLACALLDDHTVKCWGGNAYGQLGLGDTADRGDAPGEMGDALPALDLGPHQALAVVRAGGVFSCAL